MSALRLLASTSLGWILFSCAAAAPPCAPKPKPLESSGAAAPTVGPPSVAVPKQPPFHNQGGMWLPAQVPLRAAELERLGLRIDPALLTDPKSSLLGAIVNLNGCSASFVSKQGLVVTNHHCALAALQRNSTPSQNLLKDGMLARTHAEERSSGPAARLSVLAKVTEVTARVRPVLEQAADDKARTLALEKLQNQLVAECERGRPGTRCNFVSFYAGLQYFVSETLELRDIRLVYAPPESVGDFGGEIDNWRWPRQCGDVTFLRAYVGPDGLPADYAPGNVPYQPPAFLKPASTPLSEGDLVIVAGYPGHTSLLAPAVEMQQIQNKVYPERLAMFDAYLAQIAELSADDPELAIKATGRRRGFDNYRTKHLGELEGMRRAHLLEHKLEQQQALEAFIAADPERSRKFDGVIAKLADAFAERERTREADTALRRELLMPRLLLAAYRIVRMADERQKPDAERDPDYQERNVPQLRDELSSLSASYNEKLDRATLKLALQRDRARPPERRTPALALIAGEQPTDAAIDAAIAKLYKTSKLGDEKTRLSLFEHGKPAALAQHTDPIVHLLAKLYPAFKAAEDRDKRFEGMRLLHEPRYMEALLAFKGGAVAPDANGTLRISYGVLRKAPEGQPGSDIGAFTSLASLVKKATGQEPFDPPPALLVAAKTSQASRFAEKSLGDVPVDFLSDVHITGGNSGSATLNAKGELVGLAFDGTYQSVASDWVFSPDTRSIHVDWRYVLFLLRDLAHADNVLTELGTAP